MEASTDGRIQRGDATRRAILRRAVDIASVEGLDGLSIGRLATDLQVSKSGVFAHFGAKQELQLATIRAARAIVDDHVVRPALEVAPGLDRLRTLLDRWLRYSQDRVFPGGCFFFAAQAEFDARPGPVRDAITESGSQWTRLVESCVREAAQLGELAADTDPAQLCFELTAFLDAANLFSLLHDDPLAYERARVAIRARLRFPTPG
ncbi:TetR/AcrR family transcriptional regulator [Solihabitans fulvus]|uniref:TetR/AcrR family transcriptional regulator n=1 Tax=Solihabitans fulvus TaxID=1892852 RepID=A0A5B2XF50_9PSEU|nr:TetR/AcrR family transcriptional regulator [Solihabitans fulvus]